MPVTASFPLRRACLLAMALSLLGSSPLVWGRGPAPVLRLPLEAMGYQEFPSQVLASGAALLTLHYVDDQHLLVTFNRRRLMARLPDDPPEDFDRNIDAVLVEVPSGRVLARTSWRVHDIGQYLWSLGDGNFLLRVRNRLVTFAPVRGLAAGKAFEEHSFIGSTRTIGAVLLAPERNLLTLETIDDPAAGQKRATGLRTRAFSTANAEARTTSRYPVQVNFMRIFKQTETGQPVAESAGAVRAPALGLFPVDSAGYLAVIDQGQHHFAFDFHQHTGKTDELAPFDSSCQPIPFMVSRSEFIALGCRGGDQMQMVGGFNLRGEEMWEQVLPESYVNPTLAFAPAAGRFVLSRVTTMSSLATGASHPVAGLAPSSTAPVVSDVQSQVVTVYQMETGRQIFSLTCTPVLRSGGNFALSDDGSELAMVREGAVEIYRLPSLSAKDRAGVAREAGFAPAPNTAPIHLNGHEIEVAERTPGPDSEAKIPPQTPVTPAAQSATTAVDASTAATQQPAATSAAPAAQAGPALGDPVPNAETGPRKAPSLYGPGDGKDKQPAGSSAQGSALPKAK